MTIKDWAQFVRPENPYQAESGIRDRCRIKEGRNLTDAQVIFGIHHAEASTVVPTNIDEVARRWVLDAFDRRKKDFAELIAEDMAPWVAGYIVDRVKTELAAQFPDLGTLQNHTNGLEDRIKNGEFTPKQYLQPQSEVSDDHIHELVFMYCHERGIDENEEAFGDTIHDRMFGMWMPNADMDRIYTIAREGLERDRLVEEQRRKATTLRSIYDDRPRRAESRYNVIEVVERHGEPLPDIVCSMPDQFPDLTEAEWQEYHNRPTNQVVDTGLWGNGNGMENSSLFTYQDFLKLTRYPQVLTHDIFDRGMFNLMPEYHQFLALDLVTKVVFGIRDHRTWNKMKEVYSMAIMLTMRYEWGRGNGRGDVLDMIPGRCKELGISVLDLAGIISGPPALASKHRDFSNRPQNKQFRNEWAAVYKLMETLSEDDQHWHNYCGRLGNVYWSQGRYLFELDQYDWLPADMDEDENLAMRTVFELICNYGRNRWHWPEGYKDIEIPRLDLMPVEVYKSQHESADFTAFAGAPMPVESTWDWVARNLIEPERVEQEGSDED